MLAHPEMVGGTRDRLDTSRDEGAARPDRRQGRRPRGCAASRSCPARARGADRTAATGHGDQDRGRRRLRPGDVGGVGRGARPGRRARRPAAADARPIPPPDHLGSARPAGGARRSPTFELRAGGASVRPALHAPRPRRLRFAPCATSPTRPPIRIGRSASSPARRWPRSSAPTAARQGVPPRLGGDAATAAVPRDPGGVRAARDGSRRRSRGGGRCAAAGAAALREPWRADPDARAGRARAAREAARAGAAAASAGAGGATGAGGASRTASSGRPTLERARAGTRRRGHRARRRPRDAQGDDGLDLVRRGPRSGDATWSGASWYGPTSGEYWIVNPREYADPRKHGPGVPGTGRGCTTPTGSAATRPGRTRAAGGLAEADGAAGGGPRDRPRRPQRPRRGAGPERRAGRATAGAPGADRQRRSAPRRARRARARRAELGHGPGAGPMAGRRWHGPARRAASGAARRRSPLGAAMARRAGRRSPDPSAGSASRSSRGRRSGSPRRCRSASADRLRRPTRRRAPAPTRCCRGSPRRVSSGCCSSLPPISAAPRRWHVARAHRPRPDHRVPGRGRRRRARRRRAPRPGRPARRAPGWSASSGRWRLAAREPGGPRS